MKPHQRKLTNRINDLPTLDKAELRQQVEKDVRAFKRKGGKIQKVEHGKSGFVPTRKRTLRGPADG